MPCGMRGGGTAVPLSFISHGRDVAGRRAPRSPALPLAFHPTLPGGGFQPGPPLSAGYASGYFPRSSRYLVFHTVSVYYHTPGKVSREGGIFAPGLPGGNYGTMFPVRAWQGETPWFPGCGRAWRGAGAGNTAKQEKNVQKKGQGTVRGQEAPGGSAFFRLLPRGGKSGTMERINRQYSTKFDTCGSHSQERRRKICIA